MKTVLFLHGFFASGSCVPAMALREALSPDVKVLTPDLPLHPNDALILIREICRNEHPDVIVGNSCGSFYAQLLSAELRIPMLLGNPYFKMSEFLIPRLGSHEYKSPRQNGHQQFTIDNQLVSEFKALEQTQFQELDDNTVWGLFGENDSLAHFEPMFREHYSTVFHFPGSHTPTAEETKLYYAPLVSRLLTL